MLQNAEISKNIVENINTENRGSYKPPRFSVSKDHSIVRICSINDCFFCLRIVQKDRIISNPNSTTRNNPISKNGN